MIIKVKINKNEYELARDSVGSIVRNFSSYFDGKDIVFEFDQELDQALVDQINDLKNLPHYKNENLRKQVEKKYLKYRWKALKDNDVSLTQEEQDYIQGLIDNLEN